MEVDEWCSDKSPRRSAAPPFDKVGKSTLLERVFEVEELLTPDQLIDESTDHCEVMIK